MMAVAGTVHGAAEALIEACELADRYQRVQLVYPATAIREAPAGFRVCRYHGENAVACSAVVYPSLPSGSSEGRKRIYVWPYARPLDVSQAAEILVEALAS